MDQDKVLLEIVEKIGGITSSVKNMESMLDRSICDSNNQHREMWKKIDSHGKWINRIKGGFATIAAIAGLVYYWCKIKLGN